MQEPTAERILDLAERLVQTRGYNGFSYADIAESLGIRKASIHHHFATKAELGAAMLKRYRARYATHLEQIEATQRTPKTRLKRYAQAFGDVLKEGNRMCLCGMLAADVTTLPKAVRDGVKGFFDDNENWLARVLADGRNQKQLAFTQTPRLVARQLLSSLEGAMLVARSCEEPVRFDTVAKSLLAALWA